MAGNFLSNSRNQTAPSRRAGAAFGTFVFWAVVATVFPYEVLTGYWPAALTWGPVVLYGLALFNLIRAARQFSLALRLQKGRPAAQAARWSRRQGKPVADTGAGTGAGNPAQGSPRTDRSARAVGGLKPKGAMPAHTRAPTVQRMR